MIINSCYNVNIFEKQDPFGQIGNNKTVGLVFSNDIELSRSYNFKSNAKDHDR